MPRARQRHGLRSLAGGLAFWRPRAHPPLPVGVVPIPDDECERSPERPSVPQAGEHLDAVLFELLPWATPVTLLAAREVGVDRIAVENEPRRKPAEDPHERGAVRLARRCQPKRHGSKPTARRITSTGAETPVQISNDGAPCATSTSKPLTTFASGAAAAVAVSGYGSSRSVWPAPTSTMTSSRSDVALT